MTFNDKNSDLQGETVGSKLLFFCLPRVYNIAHLFNGESQFFIDEIKDTENIDPKLKDLLQGLIENVNTKDGIIVGLQNRVHFL